jgi:hypothetical protein
LTDEEGHLGLDEEAEPGGCGEATPELVDEEFDERSAALFEGKRWLEEAGDWKENRGKVLVKQPIAQLLVVLDGMGPREVRADVLAEVLEEGVHQTALELRVPGGEKRDRIPSLSFNLPLHGLFRHQRGFQLIRRDFNLLKWV